MNHTVRDNSRLFQIRVHNRTKYELKISENLNFPIKSLFFDFGTSVLSFVKRMYFPYLLLIYTSSAHASSFFNYSSLKFLSFLKN